MLEPVSEIPIPRVHEAGFRVDTPVDWFLDVTDNLGPVRGTITVTLKKTSVSHVVTHVSSKMQ